MLVQNCPRRTKRIFKSPNLQHVLHIDSIQYYCQTNDFNVERALEFQISSKNLLRESGLNIERTNYKNLEES